jgi:hypothetical protein
MPAWDAASGAFSWHYRSAETCSIMLYFATDMRGNDDG